MCLERRRKAVIDVGIIFPKSGIVATIHFVLRLIMKKTL